MGSGSPSTVSNFNPQQQNLAHVLGPVLQSQVGKGITPYSGEIVAPLNAGYQNVQDQLNSYNPQQFQAGQTGAINQALSGQPAYNLDPQTTANYFQQGVVDPSMRTYNSTTAPAINQGFAAQGGTFSTARGIAQSRALSDLQATNASNLAQTQYQNQTLNSQLAESAANRQLQGIGIANQYQTQPLYNAQQLSAALQPFQQQAQALDTTGYQQWQAQQPYNNPYLSQIMGYLGQSTQSAYQQPNYTGQYIGAGIGAAGAAASAYGTYAAQAAQQASQDTSAASGLLNSGSLSSLSMWG